jgi:ATP-binding cassette subfamily B protein
MIRSGAEIVINIIAILLLNRQCALPVIIAFVVGSICVLRLSKLFGKIDKEIDDIKARRSSELDEIINGFTEVRSFSGAIERHMKFITELNNGSVRTFFKRQMLYSSTGVTLEASTSIATIIILLYIIASNNVGAIGLSVVMYAWRLEGPFYSLLGVLSEFSDIKAAIPKFNAIMEYRDIIKDGSIELTSFENEISIEDVKFSYDKSDIVLDGISMSIPKGASIGICGTSGGGKSTLLKLIPRFFDVDSGSIKIDGINIKELKIDSLRKYMGIVHQSPYIFDGTLRANIVYGRPTATDAEIIDACKKASIYDFIASLPEGLDTKVGPRGLKLSGGQKQRISIARVFLTNPEIIILDEATSALDNETEHLVQDALRAFKGKTTITVAHRLSTIKDCDCIYVVHNHKIAESGSHNELINAGGIYAGMQK